MSAMTCEQAVRRFFGYLDRALAGEDLQDLEAHLDACLACCDRLAFSRELDAFVRARLPEAEVPAGLEARIRRALRGGIREVS
jgi:anti-sigma factor (TIGR02949 family)